MATATRVPLEVYLRSEYEPDAEYVDGEIEERPMGVVSHADWQQAIQRWFANRSREWNIRSYSEARVRVAEEYCRVPDVTVLDRSLPMEEVITLPPIAVFEVLSPEDTVKKLKKKLLEYASMGIPQIWVVDPDTGVFERFENGSLGPATRYEQGPIQFDVAEIATLLQA